MGEEQEETSRGPTPRAAYARAMRAEEKAQKALEELSEIKSALNDLINALKTSHNQRG